MHMEGYQRYEAQQRDEGQRRYEGYQRWSYSFGYGRDQRVSEGRQLDVSSWDTPAAHCRRAAEKLQEMQDILPDHAQQVYSCMTDCLQKVGQQLPQPNKRIEIHAAFEEKLFKTFGNAAQVETNVNQCQWTVHIDSQPSLHISVLAEAVGGDDYHVMRDIRSRAKLVREKLMENDARWLKELRDVRGGRTNRGSGFEGKLAEFEKACWQSALGISDWKTFSTGGQASQLCTNPCPICFRSKDGDLLGGEHRCIAIAHFTCPNCGKTWMSHNARVRPDGEILSQQCEMCRVDGREDRRQRQLKGLQGYFDDVDDVRTRGEHKADYCQACKLYGNCMGVFMDPMVIAIACKLVADDHEVRWSAPEPSAPELLVANFVRNGANCQLALHPHVYCPEVQARNDAPSRLERRAQERHAAASSQASEGPRRKELPSSSSSAAAGYGQGRSASSSQQKAKWTWEESTQSSQESEARSGAWPATSIEDKMGALGRMLKQDLQELPEADVDDAVASESSSRRDTSSRENGSTGEERTVFSANHSEDWASVADSDEPPPRRQQQNSWLRAFAPESSAPSGPPAPPPKASAPPRPSHPPPPPPKGSSPPPPPPPPPKAGPKRATRAQAWDSYDAAPNDVVYIPRKSGNASSPAVKPQPKQATPKLDKLTAINQHQLKNMAKRAGIPKEEAEQRIEELLEQLGEFEDVFKYLKERV